MTEVKAVIFDFIGTLTSVKGHRIETSKLKLYKAVVKAGFDVEEKAFLEAYNEAYEKYQAVRYEELVEVTDGVWISEALSRLGFKVDPEDARLRTAVDAFFEDYLSSLELNPCARQLLSWVSDRYRVGLVSNFTYAPVIHAALRRLRIVGFLNVVLVSEDVGWRKPNGKIYQEALKRLGARAEETVYVGDSPLEDIGGAAAAGMKTVFVPSQFYTLEDLRESGQRPDLIVKDTCELFRILPEFVKNTR